MSLRIVGGALRGRRFEAPAGEGTRPTTDRVRESLFNALHARGLVRGVVLDAFAGSGALAFEALSRGAERAVLVERERRAQRTLRGNVAALGVGERVQLLPMEFGSALPKLTAQGPFDLVFFDPPYAEGAQVTELTASLLAQGALAPGAAVVVEHEGEAPTPPAGLEATKSYRYGRVHLALWRAE